jgi:hypothetical protein
MTWKNLTNVVINLLKDEFNAVAIAEVKITILKSSNLLYGQLIYTAARKLKFLKK